VRVLRRLPKALLMPDNFRTPPALASRGGVA
jgi:hypothetical protein